MLAITHKHVIRPIVVFAHTHDDHKAFRLWFTVATVFASIILNLGIFTLLVVAHMALDVIKYKTMHKLSWHWTIVETVRESIVDVFFVVLGIFLALTLHHVVAIGGLGKMARMEAMLFNLILRVGPRIKVAEHLLEVAMYWKHYFHEHIGPRTPLTRGERFLGLVTILIAVMIVGVPFFTSMTWDAMHETMLYELTPRLELSITKTIEELAH